MARKSSVRRKGTLVATKSGVRRYVIMPKHGFEDSALAKATLAPSKQAVMLAARAEGLERSPMRVLDGIGNNGPKLVEMSEEGELSLRLNNPDLKVVPEVFYHRCWYRPSVEKRPVHKARAAKAKRKAEGGVKVAAQPEAAAAGTTIRVVDSTTERPLRGAHVVVFTDYKNHIGDAGDTNAEGVVRLDSISPRQSLERAYVYGPPGYWGHFGANTPASALKTVQLRPIDLSDPNLLLHQLYGVLPRTAGAGVTVGVIDSGIDSTHPDLQNVSGGLNCVTNEVQANPAAVRNWGPARKEGEHGTHVAGIIGATGVNGFRGVAPGVNLRSYRVFPDAGGGASNFDIAKAVDAARRDGCALINLSLGEKLPDDLVGAAIIRAADDGVVVVAAAGNEDRQPVDYPAAFPECVAVSAMGRWESFPEDSIGASDVANPRGGENDDDFIADFSNIGADIDATGPGVEIVSTLPDGQYGAMSGTSMAAPAVTGFAAYILAANPGVSRIRGVGRSTKLKSHLFGKCHPEGFGRYFEGYGLPTLS
jgi:subtilisin